MAARTTLRWSLTRPQKQGVATLVVILISIVPTGLVGLQAWYVNRPGHVHDVQVELGRTLGLHVRLGSVRYPQPGTIELRDVRLRHEEDRIAPIELVRAAKLTVQRDGSKRRIEADGLRIQADSPRRAIDQLIAVLGKFGGDDEPDTVVHLLAPSCQVDLSAHLSHDSDDGRPLDPDATPSIPLRYEIFEIAGHYYSHGRGPQADNQGRGPQIQLSFQDANGTRSDVTLRRNRQAEGTPSTIITVKTVNGALPARYLDPFFTTARWLGDEATVQGQLKLESQDAELGWWLTFQGTLERIDLAQFVRQNAPDNRITGLASLQIHEALWSPRLDRGDYGWTSVRGRLHAENGTIGARTLQRMRDQLLIDVGRLRQPFDPDGSTDQPFYMLGINFEIQADGELILRGGLPADHYTPDAILVASEYTQRPLARAPEGASSVRGLITTLVPVGNNPHAVIPDDPRALSFAKFLPATPETIQDHMLGN